MTFDRNFGGVIWTNHALSRLAQRGIKQGDAWATFRHPDQSRYAKAKGAWIYFKTYGDTRIEVVAKQNEKRQWIILSVWSGTEFRSKEKRKVEPLIKLIFKKLFGG